MWVVIFLGGTMTLLETFFPELRPIETTPYNLVRKSDSELLLELVVTGIPEESVDIELSGNVLKVSATHDDSREYLYRGIKQSSFTHKFNLRDDVEVKSAFVKNGILSVVLEIQVPEEKKPRKILLTH